MEITIPMWAIYVGASILGIPIVVFGVRKVNAAEDARDVKYADERNEKKQKKEAQAQKDFEENTASLPDYWQGMVNSIEQYPKLRQELLDKYFYEATSIKTTTFQNTRNVIGLTCAQLTALKAALYYLTCYDGNGVTLPPFQTMLPTPKIGTTQVLS